MLRKTDQGTLVAGEYEGTLFLFFFLRLWRPEAEDCVFGGDQEAFRWTVEDAVAGDMTLSLAFHRCCA